jgi:hypothetical protein
MANDLIIDCETGEQVLVPSVPLSMDDARTAKRQEIEWRRDTIFAAGFTPSTGPLAGKTLQTRNVDDRTNWLTSQAAYSAAVAGGFGSVVDATFRTADNETIVCTYAQGLQTLLAMADWGKTVMGASWALKDAVEAAADLTALSSIDMEAGWP